MMTATILENDSEIIVDEDVLAQLDFQHALPCEYPKCDTTAVWVLRYGCCGHTLLTCDVHKDFLISVQSKFKKIIHNKKSGGCGLKLTIASVEPLA